MPILEKYVMSRLYTDGKCKVEQYSAWAEFTILSHDPGHKEGCCSSGIHTKDYIEYKHKYTQGCVAAVLRGK